MGVIVSSKGYLDPHRMGCYLLSQFLFPVGPMLVAERLTRVYGRTDGGPGAALAVDGGELVSHNAPKPETPCRWWNMAFPSECHRLCVSLLNTALTLLLHWHA